MTTPAKRFPILLWGDLVEGAPPVLRRALAGYRAHECMYAWVYLTEYLAHRRLLDRLPSLDADIRRNLFARMDVDLWKTLDRTAIDPHFQLWRPMFESVAGMACLAAGSGESAPDFVELGSTFFTSRTRFEIVDTVARERFADWPRRQPNWLGIDNSRFMHDTTLALHGEGAVTLADDVRAAPLPERFPLFLSRFVASYVFADSGEFAQYLARFQAALVEDAYSATGDDVRVANHGQAEVFFSIPGVFGSLERAGFDIYVLETYPDFPAGTAPCHVVRCLAVRKGLVTAQLRERMDGLGFRLPDHPVASATALRELNDAVSPAMWRAVKRAKEISPVWGRTAFDESAPVENALLRAARSLAGRYLSRSPWRHYRLGGPLAEGEIDRAIGDEKP